MLSPMRHGSAACFPPEFPAWSSARLEPWFRSWLASWLRPGDAAGVTPGGAPCGAPEFLPRRLDQARPKTPFPLMQADAGDARRSATAAPTAKVATEIAT